MSDQTGTTALELPDYLNDLNAMHEAIVSVCKTNELREAFEDELFLVVARVPVLTGANTFETINATASQRAIAFLKTIGKWTGD
jgi:hypothetical protein